MRGTAVRGAIAAAAAVSGPIPVRPEARSAVCAEVGRGLGLALQPFRHLAGRVPPAMLLGDALELVGEGDLRVKSRRVKASQGESRRVKASQGEVESSQLESTRVNSSQLTGQIKSSQGRVSWRRWAAG